MKLLTICTTAIACLAISACSITKQPELSIFIDKPVWISGINVEKIDYTKDLPAAIDNKYLEVVNAGYWLTNANDKLSQLVYVFEMNNKRVFTQGVVYTKSILSNPADANKPIVYYGTLNNVDHTIKVTHGTVQNVAMNQTYHMIFEVYSDSENTQLITRVDQAIVSYVDNTSGCVKLTSSAQNSLFQVQMPIACGYMK